MSFERNPPVYRIRHKDATFRGVVRGLDFWGGVGSTSSVSDVVDLLDLKAGYKVIDATPAMKEAIQTERKRRAAAPIKIGDPMTPAKSSGGATWSVAK